MEILDPDLWNDDGTPKRPSKAYMKNLQEAQALEAIDPETPLKRAAEAAEAYRSYARMQRELKENQPASVGDIVHFWDNEKARCMAAMVMETEPFGHGACLRVHVPHEAFQDWQADHDEDKAPDSWHWPEGDR